MNRFTFFPFGGDYCPEQEPRAAWENDITLMKQAHINCVTLGVFSWELLEPSEGTYDFSYIDDAVACLEKAGIKTILATGTVCPPVWATRKYPDILPVDRSGRKRTHGMRAFFCVHSPNYLRLAGEMAKHLALHFQGNHNIIGYHVANEYGTACYCDRCKVAFQQYLKRRYTSITQLNHAWYTTFWGRTYHAFEEIELPTELNDDYRFYPQVQLDYLRFLTDSTIACYENEHQIIHAISPNLPIFTNISGFLQKLDQFSMVPHMDYAGFDNYPIPGQSPFLPAFKHDIMRAAGGDDVFLVTEQSPGPQNWQPYNKLKRPNEVRRLFWQGVAHGADGSLFFQMKQSLGGQEMYHGALISLVETSSPRTFKEMERIGNEITQIQRIILGKKTNAQCGIFFDWENWWALELSSGPSKDLDYLQQVFHYYKHLLLLHIGTRVLRENDDFSSLKLIYAPLLAILKGDLVQRLTDFVSAGGILVTTYLSGMLDMNGCLRCGVAPGNLRELTGLWVEEQDALRPEETNSFHYNGIPYTASFLCERIHLTEAQVIATYEKDFYAGEPCITKRVLGKGVVYYFATMPDEQFLAVFNQELRLQAKAVPFATASAQVEITKRADLFFCINHGEKEENVTFDTPVYDTLQHQDVPQTITIAPGDCRILQEQKSVRAVSSQKG